MRNRFTTHESTFIEEPRVLAMEFLVTVIGNDGRLRLVGNCQDKGIAATNGSGRRGDQFVVVHGIIKLSNFSLIDAVTETCVDNHRNF